MGGLLTGPYRLSVPSKGPFKGIPFRVPVEIHFQPLNHFGSRVVAIFAESWNFRAVESGQRDDEDPCRDTFQGRDDNTGCRSGNTRDSQLQRCGS